MISFTSPNNIGKNMNSLRARVLFYLVLYPQHFKKLLAHEKCLPHLLNKLPTFAFLSSSLGTFLFLFCEKPALNTGVVNRAAHGRKF